MGVIRCYTGVILGEIGVIYYFGEIELYKVIKGEIGYIG